MDTSPRGGTHPKAGGEYGLGTSGSGGGGGVLYVGPDPPLSLTPQIWPLKRVEEEKQVAAKIKGWPQRRPTDKTSVTYQQACSPFWPETEALPTG